MSTWIRLQALVWPDLRMSVNVSQNPIPPPRVSAGCAPLLEDTYQPRCSWNSLRSLNQLRWKIQISFWISHKVRRMEISAAIDDGTGYLFFTVICRQPAD